MDKNGKILIVDDSKFNREILSEILNQYTVIEAKNGYEALEYMKADKNIALVLLDLVMPEMDGFDIKLTSSIFVGEESGRLESMLTTLADDFDFEAEQASERMITLIQPLMIIFLAVVICLIIISVLLPIYTLYNNVGNM